MTRKFLAFALLTLLLALTPALGAQDIADVPREATVIIENEFGRVAVPDNMNPYIAGQYLDWGMWQATQESLFYLNYETGELMPWLASGYSFNEDKSSVTISIRDGVKWADGTPFTASDVVFTINMLKANPELQYSFDMEQWVADISAPDDSTVVMNLTRPNPRFVSTYFGVRIWDTILIAPQHIWEGVDPTTFTNYDLEAGLPMGTGAYRLVRSTETEQVYDRRDDWWAAETGFHALPAPQRAIWLGAPGEDLRAALMSNNELDAGWTFSRSTFEVAQSRNPNIVGWTADLPYAYLDPCPRYLGLNNRAAPFDDREVRWALNAAIDRDVLVAIAYEGMTDPAATLYPTYAPLQAFLDRNAALFEQYDVLGSDMMLIDSVMEGKGYSRDADGLWVDGDGARISFTLVARSSQTDKVRMGNILAEQVRDAGFDATFQPLEDGIFYGDVSNGSLQAWITDLCGSVSDPYETFSRFHSRFSGPIGESVPGVNASRFENTDYDEVVDAMAVLAASDEGFDDLADQALEIWLRELPGIPLVQARLLTPFNNTYWTNWPSSENNYIHPGHWWVTGALMLLNIQPAG
ncbi:MAG: ABC transporter substrate-binding protein [Anaerolineaceae bacterium]|nr:ABC transporter substrate-binding protein [Anaerolineaceae bacterium]